MPWRFSSGSVLILGVAACSSGGKTSGAGGHTATTGSTATSSSTSGVGGAIPYPAPHPAAPQAISEMGPIMTTPKIVVITFNGDSLQSSIDGWVTQLVNATAYWSGATAEYGVGVLSASAPQHMSDTLPATLMDSDVQTWLIGKINAGAGFPQPDGNTVYAIFYPATTNVSDGSGTTCQQFQGYHSDFFVSAGKYVSYAVIGRCPPPVPSVTTLDNLTAEASHEIIESATDPLPQDKPAFIKVDPDHQGWLLVSGAGEIGDLCAPFPGVFYDPPGITNLVQRVWSNKAAAAGSDPCQPGGASPYFNSAPDQNDALTIVSPMLGTFKTKGTHIAVGQSQTIALHLFSDQPTSGPWKVSALDLSSMFFGGSPALSFTLDKTQGQNGDTLELTIKALSKSALGASPFWIQNDLGGVTTVWIGVVGN